MVRHLKNWRIDMTKEEAKEFYPILHAFAEGKVIECRTKPDTISAGIPNKWTETNEIWCVNSLEYRIKPESEPKYRQFKNAEECWNEMMKHQPFGWVKDKKDGHHALITAVDDDTCGMSLNGNAEWSLSGIMDLFNFADGVPFGVKI